MVPSTTHCAFSLSSSQSSVQPPVPSPFYPSVSSLLHLCIVLVASRAGPQAKQVQAAVMAPRTHTCMGTLGGEGPAAVPLSVKWQTGFVGCADTALISPTTPCNPRTLRTPPQPPHPSLQTQSPAFQMDTNQKALLGEAEQSVGEMRLSVQTDRPSILQRPPYQSLTARESVERKGLVGRDVIGLGYQRVDEAFKGRAKPGHPVWDCAAAAGGLSVAGVQSVWVKEIRSTASLLRWNRPCALPISRAFRPNELSQFQSVIKNVETVALGVRGFAASPALAEPSRFSGVQAERSWPMLSGSLEHLSLLKHT
ncbi:unnamed protein product [Pleuronectes platessa]|uniref:Uncharacterized protein n=1 Tax=Pleuronectes platessa TaxID=8262 RepID=A0A9N7Y7N1_PLEPL|nr:unnamed protein product [Pleuronectes platessa]